MKLSRIFKVPFALLVLLSLSFVITTGWSADRSSATETSEQVAKRLQDTYHQVDSLRFLFFQTTKGQMAGRQKSGKGNALFVRTAQGPKMRWNYTSPDRQVIISDGTTISMYFENLNQMIISSVTESQTDILFSFFSDQKQLNESFTILDSDPYPSGVDIEINNGLKVIYLVPKDTDSQIRTVHLWITDESYIRRIELIDHFETTTTINISELQTNTVEKGDNKAIHDMFSFTPPKGTEIIRQ